MIIDMPRLTEPSDGFTSAASWVSGNNKINNNKQKKKKNQM